MDLHANSDYFSLADEKFDFDVSLSPASSRGEDEDDEVFVGPVSHKERCISVGVETRAEEPSWSPLTGEQFEEICQEAHQLAGQLDSSQQNQPDREEADGTTADGHKETKEDFVQDAEAKLGVFSQPAGVLSPIKRETFCVQDSPMKQLPPAIQQRLVRACGAVNSGAAKARLSTSSPVRDTKPQTRMSLRGKAGLGVGVVLPSKPAAPPASSTKTRPTPAGKTCRLPPPSKAAVGLRRSPAGRSSSRAASCEDLLSDSASVASDVSDSSLNSSLLGRRALAPPTKSGLRNPSAVKAPPPQTRRVTDRRNTSSSSSSVSSFNSSLSVSPTGKGKVNTSLNMSITGPSGRASTGISRLANPSANAPKTRRSSVYSAAADPPVARRSLSAQARKLSEADRAKASRSTPVKRPEPAFPAPVNPTPAKRVMERSGSVPGVPAKPHAGPKPKPKALVAPTPIGPVKGLRRTEAVSSPEASRIMKPKRLMSAGSVVSPPQKPAVPGAELLLTPSAGGTRSLQCKVRRASAIPTPLRRRISGIPTMTPSSLARPGRPSPASTRRPSCRSPAPADIQPFCLEEEPTSTEPPVPQSPQSSQSDQSAQSDQSSESQQVLDRAPSPSEAAQEAPEPSRNLMELQSAEEPEDQHTQTQEVIEVLLLDLPAPTLQPEEKLLIDLTNTPDLIRTAKPCAGGAGGKQLIDLSSPLIKWSPEDKKENGVNEAPLINLSF
ncbi:G2 and S phase-expressed protein 1 [Centroberyx affinis]|uniref:G2 and S phase-expressed protein 1 n=1 Tax=Centroberyx affinis TaxID=166261 RepID=UPI003A5BE426